MVYYSNELYHHGIKGMKWGVRRYQNPDGTLTFAGKLRKRKIEKTARKDAKEYARAKMFYGEGAGNRRKLIKATVTERSKDPIYKQEFERSLSTQDMAKHAAKAKSERRIRTAASKTTKTARGVVNLSLGNIGRTTAAAAVIYGAARATGMDKKVAQYGRVAVKDAAQWLKRTRMEIIIRRAMNV